MHEFIFAADTSECLQMASKHATVVQLSLAAVTGSSSVKTTANEFCEGSDANQGSPDPNSRRLRADYNDN